MLRRKSVGVERYAVVTQYSGGSGCGQEGTLSANGACELTCFTMDAAHTDKAFLLDASAYAPVCEVSLLPID